MLVNKIDIIEDPQNIYDTKAQFVDGIIMMKV
jgi:hypothetical protein